ncbi:AMP-binding enzyme [Haemophilus pittmaniae HK 85]|uniref:AMP-binding enzyme n=1 Tax=Haemophilus pittmaniae HK 85 TaxID=1035188 RepID=F9Q756_9PAST|nr:AMP-binding enzyme [Haemophilus pittmaniae HK 85]
MNLDLHFINRIRQQAQNLKQITALRHQVNGVWKDISWQNFAEELDKTSRALLACDIGVQDKIAIFAHNMPRWTIADIAALQIRAITVPIYATNTAQQAEFILNHADVRILFVGDNEQYDSALEIAENCPQLQKIVVMKDQIPLKEQKLSCHWADFIGLDKPQYQAILEQRLSDKNLSDLFTIIYTSGTTGEPKGVMLDYANLAHQLATHDQALQVDMQDISLSFLPFSHIFERAWVAYILHRGAILCYLEDTNQVRAALAQVRPTLMCAVPRFYEKIYAAVLDKVQKAPAVRRALFHWAIAVGKKHLTLRATGKKFLIY